MSSASVQSPISKLKRLYSEVNPTLAVYSATEEVDLSPDIFNDNAAQSYTINRDAHDSLMIPEYIKRRNISIPIDIRETKVKKLKDVTTVIKELGEEIDVAERSYSERLEALETAIARVEQSRAEDQVTIARLEQSRAEDQVIITRLEQSRAEDQVTIARLEQSCAEDHVTITRLEQSRAEDQVTITRLEQTIVGLEQSRAEDQVKIAQLEQSRSEDQVKISQLEQSIVEYGQHRADSQVAISNLQSQLRQLTRTLRQNKSNIERVFIELNVDPEFDLQQFKSLEEQCKRRYLQDIFFHEGDFRTDYFRECAQSLGLSGTLPRSRSISSLLNALVTKFEECINS